MLLSILLLSLLLLLLQRAMTTYYGYYYDYIIIKKNYDNLLYLMNEIKTLRFRSTLSILYEPSKVTASIIKYT